MSSRSNSGNSTGGGGASDYEDDIVAPPDTFAGDTCATPTPGDFLSRHPGSAGLDSGSSTPQCLDSPLLEGPQQLQKASPLATRQLRADDLSCLHQRAAPVVGTALSGLAQSSRNSPSPVVTSGSSASGGSNRCEDTPTSDGPPGIPPLAVAAPPQDPTATGGGGGGGRVLNIWSSSQHSLRPSKDSFTGEILDYSLTPLAGSSGTSVETETESTADSEDGTDM